MTLRRTLRKLWGKFLCRVGRHSFDYGVDFGEAEPTCIVAVCRRCWLVKEVPNILDPKKYLRPSDKVKP